MNKLLTPAELADLIRLKKQTIYNHRHLGISLPPCVQLGRLVRFPIAGVEAWIAAKAEAPTTTAHDQGAGE